MKRSTLLITFLVVFSIASVAQAEKLVLPVSMAGVERDGHRGKATAPRSAKSLEELRSLLGKEAAKKLSDRIDFATHDFVLFQWAGSGQDKITAGVEGERVIFNYKRGRTRDLRRHRQAFAVKKGLAWKVQ